MVAIKTPQVVVTGGVPGVQLDGAEEGGLGLLVTAEEALTQFAQAIVGGGILGVQLDGTQVRGPGLLVTGGVSRVRPPVIGVEAAEVGPAPRFARTQPDRGAIGGFHSRQPARPLAPLRVERV